MHLLFIQSQFTLHNLLNLALQLKIASLCCCFTFPKLPPILFHVRSPQKHKQNPSEIKICRQFLLSNRTRRSVRDALRWQTEESERTADATRCCTALWLTTCSKRWVVGCQHVGAAALKIVANATGLRLPLSPLSHRLAEVQCTG